MKFKCPVCNQNSNLIMQFEKGDIFQCNNCSHMFSKNVQLKPDEIYSAEYFLTTHENFFKYPDLKLYDKISNYIRTQKNQDVSIIDLGCGTGNFLKYLNNKGFNNLTGIDLIENNDTNIKYIQSDILKCKFDKKFDVIVSNMNIEHIDNLDSYISKIDSILEKDGIVIINTINEHSLIYRISKILYKFNIKFVAKRLYDYHHVNHFSVKSLELLFDRSNFKSEYKIVKNYSLKSIDVQKGIFGSIQKIFITFVFFISTIFKLGISQTQFFRKE